MTSRVKVELAYKMNVENYESFELRLGTEADKQPDETTPEAIERVWDMLTEELKKREEEVREVFKRT